MRKDLHQVIVDEPRRGSRFYSKIHKGVRRAKRFKLDEDFEIINDDFGNHVSMRCKRFRHESKNFGDHVEPLYRCLEKQVGRPWNDIFSELCRYYDRRSMVGLHVHQHLRDRINRNVYFDHEGQVCNVRFGALSSWRLFVDQNGILRRASDYNKPWNWKKIRKERAIEREEERRKIIRYFDLNGNERDEEVPVIVGDLSSGGITFELKKTGENHKHYNGETIGWFKYHYEVVRKIRSIIIGYDEDQQPVYCYESYKTLERVRSTASKKEIRDYGLTPVISL